MYTAISHNYDERQRIRMELHLAPFYAKVPIILMDRKLDDIESYGRRQNLRIVGIPMPGNGVRESDNDCLEKVKKEVQKLDVMGNIPDCVFDRAQRVGKGIVDENGKVTSKPMIMRFVSWRARTAI